MVRDGGEIMQDSILVAISSAYSSFGRVLMTPLDTYAVDFMPFCAAPAAAAASELNLFSNFLADALSPLLILPSFFGGADPSWPLTFSHPYGQ